MKSINKLQRFFSIIHLLILLAVYSILTVRALFEFHVSHDYLTYHLPSALSRFGLTTYRPNHFYNAAISGFPPLVPVLQGFLVYLTGRLSFANGHNALVFLLIAWASSRLVLAKGELRWFLTAALAIPLVGMHFGSGGNDLTVASSLLLGFAGLWALEKTEGKSIHGKIALAAGVIAGCLSKYTAIPTAGIIWIGAAFIYRRQLLTQTQRLLPLAFLIIVGIGMAIWPIRNIIVFENPFYPFPSPIGNSNGDSNFANIQADVDKVMRPDYLHGVSRPAMFGISAFEITRFLTEIPMTWSLDGGHPLNERFPHNRLGGWGGITMVILTLLFGYAGYRKLIPPVTLTAIVLSIICVSFMAQSHELRYWLFVPITLALFGVPGLMAMKSKINLGAKVILCMCAGYVLWETKTVDPRTLDFRLAQDFAPKEAKEFWATAAKGTWQTVCDRSPFTIYWSGPTFNQFEVQQEFSCDKSTWMGP